MPQLLHGSHLYFADYDRKIWRDGGKENKNVLACLKKFLTASQKCWQQFNIIVF